MLVVVSRRCSRIFVVVALALLPGAAAALDWSGVAEREVVLFYPGQASWEWALTEQDHSAAQRFRKGTSCKACHGGEEHEIGAAIVAGRILSPASVEGRPGSIAMRAQVAHDGQRLHFRFRWRPGDGGAEHLDPDVAARVTVMLDDGMVEGSARAGCWVACHDDAIGMASAPADGRIRKYLGVSRARLTRQGGGEAAKPIDELEALKSRGVFLEYRQARLNPGRPAEAVSGYILETRHERGAGDLETAAEFLDGEWVVTMSRPLAAEPGTKALREGTTYHLGFAIHDQHADHRHHHVSLEYTLRLSDGEADFVAPAR